MSKPKKIDSQEFVTEFDVNESGTLSISNFSELEIRSEFYESVADSWTESPSALAEAMDECPPLAWAVHDIYNEIREEIEFDLRAITSEFRIQKMRKKSLTSRLKFMPEEPEEGAEAWLLSLTSSEFEDHVLPVIERWFEGSPQWNSEEEYLPRDSTAQGAALEFFHGLNGEELDVLGVVIVEGDHPGSTYYAAELTVDVDAANKAALQSKIPVRFNRI